MRDMFFLAVKKMIEQYHRCSVDLHGNVQCIHESLFDNLEMEFEAYCKKHHINKNKKWDSHIKTEEV